MNRYNIMGLLTTASAQCRTTSTDTELRIVLYRLMAELKDAMNEGK